MAACRYRKRLLKSCTFCIYTPSIYMEIIRDNSYRCIYICNKVSGKLQIFQCVYRHILLHNTPAVKPFTLQITCHAYASVTSSSFPCPPETITCTSGCSFRYSDAQSSLRFSESVIFPASYLRSQYNDPSSTGSRCSFF